MKSKVPVRVIPCLDITEGRVVKGVKFENVRDAGDPVEAAARYSAMGADELVVLDIYATLEGRSTRFDLLKRIVEASSMPVSSGGGYSSLADIEAALNVGISGVAVNSAALKNPALIADAVKEFGPRIVCAIDAEKGQDGVYYVLVKSGRERLNIPAVDWAKRVEELGAREIVLTSHDADGGKSGYDIALTRLVSDAVSIPVVASGGAGQLSHFVEAVTEGHASAVLAATLFHFGELTIAQVKQALRAANIPTL